MRKWFIHSVLLLLSLKTVAQVDSLKSALDSATDPEVKRLLTNRIAEEYFFTNLDSAEFYSKKALTFIDSARQPKEFADIINNIGTIEASRGNYYESMDLHVRGATIYEMLDDPVGKAISYQNLANLYDYIGESEEAQKFYGKSLKIFMTQTDSNGISGVLNNIGETYFNQGDYEEALVEYERALDYANRPDVASFPLHNIGRTYQRLGQHSKAVDYLKRGLEIDMRVGDNEGVAYDYHEIGRVYLSLKNYALAKKNLLNSLKYASDLGLKAVIADNYQALSEIYYDTGDFGMSLNYQEKFIALKDSIFNEDRSRAIASLKFSYDVDRHERELELLRLEEQRNSLKRSQSTLFIVITLIVLVLGLATIYLVRKQKNSIEAAELELEELNQTIYDRNNHLRHFNSRLQYSEKKLKELNSTKDKFFSIISHDLRSPLNSLSGLLQVMMKNSNVFTSDELVTYAKKINDSVKSLSELLENLLQWSQNQMGEIDFQPEVFFIDQEIKNVAELYKLSLENKEVDCVIDAEEDFKIYADRDMFNFVIRNLISNAVKFTPRKGTISISVREEGKYLVIEIRDTGVGMGEDQIEKLFEIQHHMTTVGTEKEKGTGLGLILCNEFVKRNKGRIVVESNPGEGSEFQIYLPRAS